MAAEISQFWSRFYAPTRHAERTPGESCPYPMEQRHQQICNLPPGWEQWPTPNQLRRLTPGRIGMDPQLLQLTLLQRYLLIVPVALDSRAL